ncbi:MAG: S-adenosylmethionine:tRNA ribosyltransferase-isomerase [Lentimicrobium sp.]|jgi:S-adenosylmethionine:tRNA ribosyltransferase-isomerase|nr:S-adenosylmethionine:tRNA ribosyltransferase-isomerase [Lentimicrobium sp.]
MKEELYIPVVDYDYPLPEERIARFPVDKRDESKLVILKEGEVSETIFSKINTRLPEDAMLVFNNTRVIHARLRFATAQGAAIEVFCLQSLAEVAPINGSAIWKCFIGNARKWKSGLLQMDFSTPEGEVILTASRGSALEDAHLVHFNWNPATLIFEQVLEYAGKIPLPPYIKRAVVESDKERYQTVYAQYNGSVAAPTAGLHFTPGLLEKLSANGVSLEFLTLHVGAGTFKPVSADNAIEHHMHAEEVLIEKAFLIRLIQSLDKNIIPVGTTSMRSLESLYWIGVQLIEGHMQEQDLPFIIKQWMPYETKVIYPAAEALQAIVDYMSRHRLTTIRAVTSIMIVPGYHFRVCNALITNFHQPRSTLLMLVAAFVGNDWKKVYDYALSHDFRFLSYGDSCLLFKSKGPA